jgi:hypothetical protein
VAESAAKSRTAIRRKWLTTTAARFCVFTAVQRTLHYFWYCFYGGATGQQNLVMKMADNDGSLVSSCESSDGSWTPSIDSGEDSDEDDEFVWRETPLQASKIRVIFDNLDDIMAHNYAEEMAEIRRRIKRELLQLRAGVPGITRNDEADQVMTANEIFNAIFHTTMVYEFIGTMNLWLSQHKHKPMDYHEFQTILRLIFWFCYYGKGPSIMTKNIENFPEPNELISLLHGNNFSERRERLYNLLRAFDGDSQDDHQQGSMTWSFVYGQDRLLEEMFDKMGNVRLCIRACHGHQRTCAERFHSITDPRVLFGS